MHGRLIAGAAALMIAATAACSSDTKLDTKAAADGTTTTTAAASTGATTAPTTAPATTARGATAQAAPTTQPAPTTGTLEVAATTRAGKPVPGVSLKVAGPTEQVVATDGSGVARATLPAGGYTVTVVPGCAGEHQVTGGSSGSANVVAGQTSRGAVKIDGQRRYAPDSEKYPSDWQRADGKPLSEETPTWHAGVAYTVAYALVDRCSGGKLAPNAPSGWKIAPSPNAAVTDPGTGRSDGTGYVRFTAQCSADGAVTMTLSDPDNANEEPQEILARSKHGLGRPNCRTA